MILSAIAKKLKRQSTNDFKGRHFEAWLALLPAGVGHAGAMLNEVVAVT